MNRYRKPMQIVILLAIIAVGIFTLANSLFNKTEIPKAGSTAPAFTLPLMQGGETSLEDYKDQVVVINFWGTYCPPCVNEMPLIQRHYDEYKDQGLVVLGVNENDPLVTAKAFVKQYQLTFPILMDRDTVRKRYGVTAYPTTVFVNRKGKIVEIRQGEMDEAYLSAILNDLLKS